MELQHTTLFGVDLSSEAEVLSYRYTGEEPIEVVARIQLGLPPGGLSGIGGGYQLNFYLNNVVIEPVSIMTLAAGLTSTFMVGRVVPLESNDLVSLRVIGLPQDTSVDTDSTLRNVTPLRYEEIGGSGIVAIDHNYGGLDNLTVETYAGVRLSEVIIWAYRREDYEAGNYNISFVLGQSTTNQNGQWVAPIMLDPGDYTLLVFKQGVIESTFVNITVTA